MENAMKLSARELKFYSEVETRFVRRKRDAWLSLAGVILLIVLTENFALFSGLGDVWIFSLVIPVAVGYLAHVYFAVRPEDKLVELLQRYVNQDPEAVAQIANSTERNEVTDENRPSPSI
jgi:hypothetical protein